ncbi:MAG TPA: MFS transporter [Polyangiales bacterium]|nr:MFS transporter [Polyangiales bacterium]
MVDELWSGVAVVAAPEVEKLHEVSHAQYTLWVFAVPILLSSLIEAPIALVSDRLPRQRLLASSLAMLAAALGLAAFATTPWFLAGALSLAGAASGVACDSAQAELITRHPGGPTPAMARWLAFAAAGDALVPLVIAAAYWLGGTHRSALCVCALLLAAQSLSAFRAPKTVPVPVPDDTEGTIPLRAALAQAARKPRLWLFLFGASACTLLDEVVVALGALRLHQDLGWTESQAALVMTGLSSGAVLGALISERLLKTISSRRLLIYAAAASCILLAVVATADSAPVIVTALFCLGMTCALHWPLVKAAAYELVPGQPGVVNALQQAFVGMDIALPLLVGLIASHFGLAAALASLVAEPVILLIVAAFWRTSKSECPEVAPR